MTTITLDYPITVNGEKVTELEMRRPKLRDQLWLKAQEKKTKDKLDDLDTDVAMFARLLDVEPEVLGEMDMGDWGKLGETYTELLKPSTSSQS